MTFLAVRKNVNGVVSKTDFGGLLAVARKLIKKSQGTEQRQEPVLAQLPP
jgi:hypothetical protein